jgi:hypothetical protein
MGLTRYHPLAALSAALLALAAAPPPAPAPPPAADRDESDPVMLRRWYEHGQCLVKREGRLAEKILAAAPDSLLYLRAFVEADTRAHCFDDASTAAPKLHRNAARGAIVEALLLRDFSAVGVLRARRAAPVFDLAAGPGPVASGLPDRRARGFLKLAECTVELEPVKSFAVFSTPVAGPEESAAVAALVPALGQCLPPGLELAMRPPMLRSYLAEAAYRVSVRRLAPGGR